MPVTKPARDTQNIPEKIKNQKNKKQREILKRSRATARWFALRVTGDSVFDNYLYSEAYRKAVHTGCYVRVGESLVVKPIGNHMLTQGLDVDEYIQSNAGILDIQTPRDVLLHRVVSFDVPSYSHRFPGRRAPSWKMAHAHRSPIRHRTSQITDAYKVKKLHELTKNEFLNIVGGTGGQEPPNNFRKLFEQYLDRSGVTMEDLSELTGIPDRTIRRIKNEPERRPTLEHLIAICIALHLLPSESEKLITAAGYSFKETPKERALRYLIDCAYDQTVEDCNEFLKKMDFKPLTNL